jgi:hypothetical protein
MLVEVTKRDPSFRVANHVVPIAPRPYLETSIDSPIVDQCLRIEHSLLLCRYRRLCLDCGRLVVEGDYS